MSNIRIAGKDCVYEIKSHSDNLHVVVIKEIISRNNESHIFNLIMEGKKPSDKIVKYHIRSDKVIIAMENGQKAARVKL